MMQASLLIAFLALVSVAQADIYLHNVRGSNNRLDEANRDRNNGNRLFDSQNNNRGGNNVGSLYFYAGSVLPLTWTNQHGCGQENVKCNMVIQYMCDDKLRDGTTTNRIPTNPAECRNFDCDNDVQFGRHESYDWYMQCRYRLRNRGLFTANQRLNGNSARFTRQNANGNRHGYECPEERDYYPYWYPSVWRDIAILTDDATKCAWYRSESQNVKSRWYCALPAAYISARANQEGFIPINKEACEALVVSPGETGVWTEVPSFGIPEPICRENQWSRDNHLGNGLFFGENVGINITVPGELIHDRCVFRVRYNISTNDYVDWNTPNQRMADHRESQTNGNANQLPAKLDVWSKFGLNVNPDAPNQDPSFNPALVGNQDNNDIRLNSRGYVFKNNPRVDIFGSLLSSNGYLKNTGSADTPDNRFKVRLQLAINTNQFSRTFEDRSHRHEIRAVPSELAGATIHNVNVRGKRGNIVQTFPGTEYDFYPTTLQMKVGDYVHFQWTGSNTNPNNNAGQGRAGSDIHNVVVAAAAVYDENSAPHIGHHGRYYPGHIDEIPFLGLSREDRVHLAILDNSQLGGEMSELDDAGTYFDLGPKKVTLRGHFNYLSSRNNNFSNRNQQAKIVVSDNTMATVALGWTGGWVNADSRHRVWFPEGALTALSAITVNAIPSATSDDPRIGNVASNFVEINPTELSTSSSVPFRIFISYSASSVNSYVAYRADHLNDQVWFEVPADFSGGVATVQASRGGSYVIASKPNVGVIIGATIAAVAVIAIVIATVVYFKKNPEKWAAAKRKAVYIKRSMESKV